MIKSAHTFSAIQENKAKNEISVDMIKHKEDICESLEGSEFLDNIMNNLIKGMNNFQKKDLIFHLLTSSQKMSTEEDEIEKNSILKILTKDPNFELPLVPCSDSNQPKILTSSNGLNNLDLSIIRSPSKHKSNP